jgi:KDO2-lipid IV(A) lauroyltransferase
MIAWLTALLPARLAYWVACRRADWSTRRRPEGPAIIKRNLLQVFGETLSPAEAERLAREFNRAESCELIDIMRLRNRTPRPLGKLVEFRGREHLEAAMAEGKGAILCTAHVGSYASAFSLIHASGIPVTSIGRWWWNYDPAASPAVRRLWDFAYARRLLRYRQGPNIEPWTGRIASGVQAVRTLRRNEVVTILSDAPPLASDESRVVKVPFFGREGTFLPGVIHLARSSGAPVLMMSVVRSPDYRHQVVEISPPLSLEGEPQEALARCAAAMEATIRSNPALWLHWSETDFLADLGLIPRASSPRSAVVA